MTVSIRSMLLVLAVLSGSSVAPAQVTPLSEPLIPAVSTAIPVLVTPEPVAIEPQAVETEDAQDEDIDVTGTLEEKVAKLRSTDPGSAELECLAGAIYFEAKSEPLKGQLAVGHVIADRADSGRFPSTYCGVVYQRSQFSFVRGRSMPPIARSSRQWQNAVAIAKIVDQDMHPAPIGKALFFHARRVSPGWRLTRVGTIGNHVFYR